MLFCLGLWCVLTVLAMVYDTFMYTDITWYLFCFGINAILAILGLYLIKLSGVF